MKNFINKLYSQKSHKLLFGVNAAITRFTNFSTTISAPFLGNKKLYIKPGKASVVVISILIALQPIISMFISGESALAVRVVSQTATLYPDGDNTAGWAAFTDGYADGETCDATHHWYCVNEASLNTTDYINTGLSGTDGEIEDYTIQDPSITGGTFVKTTEVRVKWHADSQACNGGAPACDSVTVNIFINGALQSGQTTTLTTTPTTYTTTFSGSWAAINDLRIRFTRNRLTGGGAGDDDDIRLYQAYAEVDYNKAKTPSKLSLTGYIWESEDGSTGDDATQLTAGSTALSGMPLGNRVSLRTQLKNTGAAMDVEDLGLFYDRNDGYWSKATDIGINSPQNDTTLFNVHTTGNMYNDHTDVAFDSAGAAWVAYPDGTNADLYAAKYVGSGGNCDTSYAGSDAWQCYLIDNAVTTGSGLASIAIDSSGNPWISYYRTGNDLQVAQFVGSGGDCDTLYGGNDAWECTAISTTPTVFGSRPSIAFDETGKAWITYRDNGDSSLYTAEYVATGGNCNSTAWTCTKIANNMTSGGESAIGFDSDGNGWITYYGGASDLRLAWFVGSGGDCDTLLGGASDAWSCIAIDTTGTVGQYNSIDFDASGNPWVSYHDGTDLVVAKYVGSGGDCDTVGAGSDAWECDDIETTNSVGQYNSITFDNNGTAWISYYDATNTSLRLAEYVGSGGTGCAISSWNCVTVDVDDTVGTFSAAAASPSGDIWISYIDSTTFDFLVTKFVPGGSDTVSCSASLLLDWSCQAIDTTGTVGQYNSVAFDKFGNPWVSYHDGTDLVVAKYVGSGGDCDTVGAGSDAWECDVVESTNSVGQYNSIAIDNNGKAWISYYDATNSSLRVAEYVGSGGTGCASSDWNCVAVDLNNTVGLFTGIAIDAAGNPWVSYTEQTSFDFRVARYVGSGGNCDTSYGGSDAWECTPVHTTGNMYNDHTDIVFDSTGAAWAAYPDGTNTDLYAAKYVGSGGNCDTSYAGSDAWQCYLIDNAVLTGSGLVSIEVDVSGNPWVTYMRTGNDLQVAQFVSSGGDCDTLYGGNDAWECTAISTTPTVFGSRPSIGFDVGGAALISYRNNDDGSLYVAKYVGSGGNCNSTAWTCAKIANNFTTSGESAIGFDRNGDVWITYYGGSSDLRLATLSKSGEISIVAGQRVLNGAALSESHADMTSTTDTANRDDADCIGGGTWNNGKLYTSHNGGSINIPDGSGTAQCTEVTFILDLSRAEPGATYRFMIATNDGISQDKGLWRGPISVTSYPTLSISSKPNAEFSYRTAKDNAVRLADCADTAWGCANIETTNDIGQHSSMTFDANGNPWVAYYDVTNTGLRVANYSAGSWTTTAVDTDSTVGQYSSIAFDNTGSAWVSYYDAASNNNLKVAKYVGSGGSGCASSAWTCTTVDSTNDVGQYSSIAVDAAGDPLISYYDNTNGDLRYARYVGVGGTGCASLAWTCGKVDETNTVGQYSSVAFDRYGKAWISYYDAGSNNNLRVAINVGFGGTGCVTTAWSCSTVESTNDVGKHTSIAFDTSGNAHVSYYDTTNTAIRYAKYTGSWTITALDNSAAVGEYSSIAVDSAGNPWISYYDAASNNNLRVARYHGGSSGSGCTSTAWTCVAVDTANDVGSYSSLAFDNSGAPWVSYYDSTGNNNLRVAKLHRSISPLSATSSLRFRSRNAPNGEARYRAVIGRSVTATDGICSGNADYQGACAIFHASGDYDSVTAQINESPYTTYAYRYDTTTELPTAQWIGSSTLAPSTSGTAGDLYLQVYRYGTTNAWETVTSDTATSSCTDTCTISGMPSGTASEYFSPADSNGRYWVHFRVYQEASSSTTITLKTDQFKAPTNLQKTHQGTFFVDGVRRPLNRR